MEIEDAWHQLRVALRDTGAVVQIAPDEQSLVVKLTTTEQKLLPAPLRDCKIFNGYPLSIE